MADDAKGTDETRVALVTGASRGIGKTIAESLGKAGFHVVGTATTETGATQITQNLLASGCTGSGQVLRAGNAQDLADLMGTMKDSCGLPVVLVNNAGVTRDNLLLRMSDDEWQEVMQANLGLLFAASKACLRGMMKARWGRIINISSVVASSGNPGQTNYVTSKAGIEGFTRALALEVASRNITVNAVAPGFISTDMTAELTTEQSTELLAKVPLARMGEPAEVAAAVAFLASDAAAYITGETLHINGGLYMS